MIRRLRTSAIGSYCASCFSIVRGPPLRAGEMVCGTHDRRCWQVAATSSLERCHRPRVRGTDDCTEIVAAADPAYGYVRVCSRCLHRAARCRTSRGSSTVDDERQGGRSRYEGHSRVRAPQRTWPRISAPAGQGQGWGEVVADELPVAEAMVQRSRGCQGPLVERSGAGDANAPA